MGQRSQIYVRYENQGYIHGKGRMIKAPAEKSLIARYYQWNYGERMISRAKYGIEWLITTAKYGFEIERKAYRMLDVNFDMHDVQMSADIIQEWKDWGEADKFKEHVFEWQDNNDGQLYIDIDTNGNVKYAFTHPDTGDKILSATEYMQVDYEDWETSKYITDDGKQTCRENMAWIEANAALMTAEELEELKNYDYKIEKPQSEQTAENEIEIA